MSLKDTPSDSRAEIDPHGEDVATLSPVQKLNWLAALCALEPRLTRSEIAVGSVLANMANAETGICWPSFEYLARKTATTRRQVMRAVQSLKKRNLIEFEHGPSRSNVYRLRPIRSGGSDTHVTTPVTPTSPTRDTHVTTPVTPMSPESGNESIKQSVYQSASKGRNDKYPQFWEIGVQRVQVRECEELITQLLNTGVALEDIISGAERWMAHPARENRMTPLKWLKSERWRDDWQEPQPRRRRML